MAKTSSITWASHSAELKSFLGVDDASEDDELQRWLRLYVDMADRYLKRRDFTDDDGNDAPVPQGVVDGVFAAVKLHRKIDKRPFGLTGRKTGEVSEQFAVGSRIEGGDVPPGKVFAQVKSYFVSYRKNFAPKVT